MHGQAYCIIILNCEVETFDFTAEKIIICAFSSIFLFSWNQKHHEKNYVKKNEKFTSQIPTDGRKHSDFEPIGLLIFYLLFSDSDCFINI